MPATPTHLGVSNNAALSDANFLRVFSGEVLTAFERKVSMKGLVRVRNISQGSQAKFPSIGRTSASYHTPGAVLAGNVINMADQSITIDGLLTAHTFIDELEENINHFDVRSEFSTQLGEALALQYDQDCIAELALGADVITPRITGQAELIGTIVGDGTTTASTGAALAKGLTVTQANFTGAADAGTPSTNADTCVESIYNANEILDENHVPDSDRYALVTPHVYNLLVNSTKAINRDWNAEKNGSIKTGKVFEIAGTRIIKNTSALTKNLAGGTVVYPTAGTQHAKDLTNYHMIVFHKSATGVVQLKGLKFETEYDIRRQGTLMVAKFALGTKWLRPEAVVAFAPGA